METMLTFKQFLEAETLDLSTMSAPQQSPQQPQSATGNKLKGSLTNSEKRVLAMLSSNQLKSSPGRARDLLSGDRNTVQAVKILKKNFNAVDVTPDGITINQTGIDLANNQGIVDPNTGELTDLGKQLVSTTSSGTQNSKTQDIANGGMSGGQQPPAPPMGGGMPGV